MRRYFRVGLVSLALMSVLLAGAGVQLSAQPSPLWFQTIRMIASGYINWGATGGSGGYGLRDNAGTIEVKNSGGAWASASGAPYPGAGLPVSTGAAWGTSLSSTAPTFTTSVTSPTFGLAGNVSAAAWTTTGVGLAGAAATYTDTTTAAAGTVAVRAANSFGAPTFASTNAITVTDGFTLYVPKPIAGTNTTLTRANSAYFEGNVGIGTTTPLRALQVYGADTTATISNARNGGILRLATAFAGLAGIQFATSGTDASVLAAIYEQPTSGAGNGAGDIVLAVRTNTSATDITEYWRFQSGGKFGVGTWGTTIPVPQTLTVKAGDFGVYNTYTATDYEGATLVSTTGAVTLSAVTLGTGADNRDLVFNRVGTGVVSGNGAVAVDADVKAFAGPLFVVPSDTNSQSMTLAGYGNNGYGSVLNLLKTKSTGTDANVAVSVNTQIGIIQFGGADGAVYRTESFIGGYVDGAVSSGVMPTRLNLWTGNAERYRVDTGGKHWWWQTGPGIAIPADATNYEGFSLTMAAGTATLAAETKGTGTDNIDLVLTPAGTGVVSSAAVISAAGYKVGANAGIDKTCGGPVVSATFEKGIVTAMVCTSEPQPTPAELMQMIADLRAELAALKARQ